MRKKLLLTLMLIFVMACLFTIAISATPQNYKSYEVELISGEKITVYETYGWDTNEGRVFIRDTMYTEAPSDTDGVYATLDWSQVKVIDFTNVWLHKYNSSTNSWDLTSGKNNTGVFHLFNNSFTPANCTNLEKVITGKLTYIRGVSLKALPALKEIVIDNALVEIQYNAFDSCNALTTITVKDGTNLKTIGQQAFIRCKGLKSITLPNTITSMGTAIFQECTSLENVSWPTSYTKIPNATFNACKALKDFAIPNYITEIGSSAFNGCTSLTSVHIPASVTYIGSDCWRSASNLASVTFDPNCTVKKLYAHTFDGTAITEITVPNTVTSIGQNCFACTKLTSINLGASFTDFNASNAGQPPLTGRGLEYLYLSDTFTADGLRSKIFLYNECNANDLKSTYLKLTVFYVGTKEQAEAILDKANTPTDDFEKLNGIFASMTLLSAEEYATQKKNGTLVEGANNAPARYFVYGYSKCDAFYNGEHKMGEATYELPENYISNAYDKCFCSQCNYIEIVKEYKPIISLTGFSAREDSKKVCMTYKIDKEALDKYEAVTEKTLSIGVTAAAGFDSSLEEFETVNSDLTPIGKAIVIPVNKEYGSFDFVLSGFSAEHYAKALVMCAYVSDGASVSYVDTNCKSKATVFTFAEKIA